MPKNKGLCADCENPKICAKTGCIKEKINAQSFMGDKYAKRKMK